MPRAHDEAVQLASDPATPLGVLHELAMNNPEVHALLAENPSTYPDLLTWLSSRGNPEVNAALARRAVNSAESASHSGSPSTPTKSAATDAEVTATQTSPDEAPAQDSPIDDVAASPSSIDVAPENVVPDVNAEAAQPAIEDLPTAAMDAIMDDDEDDPTVAAAAAAATAAFTPPTAALPPLGNSNGPARQSIIGERPSNAWGYGPAYTAPTQPVQQPVAQTQPIYHNTPQQGHRPPALAPAAAFPTPAQPQYEEPEDNRGNKWWLWLLVGAVALLALIGILFLVGVFGSSGGDGADTDRVPQTETATDPATDDEATDETDSAEPEPEDGLEGAAMILATTISESTCENTSADAEAFNTFASSVRDAEGGWNNPARVSTTTDALDSLQMRCNPGYALAVKKAADLDDVDLGDWLVPIHAAPNGAEQSNGFSSVSGNIHCSLTENSAYCTIQQFNFTPGGDCRPGNPATLMVDASDARYECGGQSAGGATLAYDESVVNGVMACTSAFEGVSCWNTLTGSGFKVARAAATLTEQEWGPGRQ